MTAALARCWREGCDPVLEDERVRCSMCGLAGPTGWKENSCEDGWNWEMEIRNRAFFVGTVKNGYWVRGNERAETYEELMQKAYV